LGKFSSLHGQGEEGGKNGKLELENGCFHITNKIILQVTRAAESAVVSGGFLLNWSARFSFPLCVNLVL